MSQKTLKGLLKSNIELAQDSIYFDDNNTKINELFTAQDQLEVNALLENIQTTLVNILSKFSHLPEILFALALKLDDEESYEEAIFYYRLSNQIQPNPKAINNIAIIYANSDRVKYAKEILAYGLNLFPLDETIIENNQILSNI